MIMKALKAIWNFFKKPWVIALIITIILSLFVWFVGPLIAISEYIIFESTTARFIGIILLFFFWGLYIVMKSRKEEKNALENPNLAEKILEDKKDKQEKSDALKNIRDKVKSILKTIRTSTLYEHKNRSRYALPWFLILGTQESGKTSFLLNSGLKFPINKETDRHLYNLKGTEDVEALYSNEAVFIDTPGNFADSHKGSIQHTLWLYLCTRLFKARPTQAINGLIVCVSMRELLNADSAKRIHLAREIRERLDEIQRKMRITIPIYLVFTKCDVISGFNPFFSRLSRAEKEQIFGCVTHQQSMSIAEAHNELQSLAQNLNSQIIHKIHQERIRDARGDIFIFPQEFANLSTRIEDFIADIIESSRYHHQVSLQGFFFTCALDSRDLLASSTSGGELLYQTGFQPVIGEQASGFFLLELIKRVILPQKDMQEQNGKHKFIAFFHGYAPQLLVASLFIVSAIFLGINFSNNYSKIEDFDKQFVSFNDVSQKNKNIFETVSVLPELSAMLKLREIYNPEEDSRLMYKLGLYQGDKVELATDQAYLKLLNTKFLSAIKKDVEMTLLRNLDNPIELKQILRVYLMLHDPNRINKEFLLSWLSTQWSINYRGQGAIQEDLFMNMNYLVDNGIEPASLNSELLESVRKSLLRIPIQILVYQELQEEAELEAKPFFTFRTAIGATPLMGDDLPIPYLYTKAGYEEYLVRRLPTLIQEVTSDSWIYGDTPLILSALDVNRVNREVRALYFRDYVQKWNNAVQSINVEPAKTLSDIRTQVDLLSTGISPITLVLRELKLNTSFVVNEETSDDSKSDVANALASQTTDRVGRQLSGVVGSKAGHAIARAGLSNAQETLEKINQESKQDALSIQQSFANLHVLLDTQNNPALLLKDANDKMIEMSEYLTKILVSDATEERILAALLEIADEKDTVLRVVETTINKLPNPVRSWYLAYNSATINRMLAIGAYSINKAYKETVLGMYNANLRYHYPIDNKATQDVNLEDFTEFFRSGGILDNFHTTYLRPFLDNTGKLRNIMGHPLPVAQYNISALLRASNIRRAFFLSSRELGIHMMIEPYALDDTVKSARLSSAGKHIDYWHGPIAGMNLVWPTKDASTPSELRITALNGVMTQLQTRGDWSLFRIFKEANIKSQENNTCLVEVQLQGKWVQFLFQFRNRVNPFDTTISSFVLPQGL